MKKVDYYFIVLLILFSSCADWQDKKKLDEIRELGKHDADSALLLLETNILTNLLSDKNLAEWCLLNGELRKELQRPMEIDTLLLRKAVNYYDKQGTKQQLGQAGFLLGRVHVENEDYNRAVPEYLFALDAALDYGDYDLAGHITSYLGDVYLASYDGKNANELFEKAAGYFLQANNMRSYGIAIRDMSYSLMQLRKFEEALQLLEVADSVACLLHDSTFMASVANHKGVVYTELNKYDLAEKYFFESLLYKEDILPTLFALSELYEEQGDFEKAIAYMDEFREKSGNDSQTDWMYWNQRANISKRRGDYKEALECFEYSSALLDTLMSERNNIRIEEISRKYDFSKIAEENISLSNRSKQQLIWILFFISICLLLYVVHLRKINRQKFKLKTQEHALKEERQKSKDQELQLREREIELQEIALEKTQKQQEMDILREQEKRAKQNLLKRSVTFKKINMLAVLPNQNTDDFKLELKQILNTPFLVEKDWEAIKSEINYVYSGFTEELLKKIPVLTEEEIRFCCLLKVGFETNELSSILRINIYSVNRRRYRINKKIREFFPEYSWQEFLDKL